MKQNKVTMQSIADKLNISKSLVSKALSNQAGVSEETKERVRLEAIRSGYRFNSSIMNVPSSETGIIAVLLPREDLYDIEYWGRIIRCIEEELSKKSFSMILAGIDTMLSTSDGMPACITDRKVDGALILGFMPIAYIIAVQSTGIPAVLVDSLHYQSKLDHVLAENYCGGYDATRFLLDKGHRKIGFAGDISYALSFKERYRGYLDAIKDFGEQFPGEKIEQYPLTADRAGSRLPLSESEALQCFRQKEIPTALFCANDPVAFLVLQLMEKCGLNCPDDISLIGFDNVDKCEWVSPALTSVDARKDIMGQRAVQQLLRRMEEGERRPEHLMITTEIVERNSVASRVSATKV
ncbi:LacI family DNA-binding transcriptional regulator [Cohnella soli]|uniref:LacI family DNA-binding transcriptional regulator n=1 Tax=Cohnella soli TaxID=425005 RepID=A0ABW0I399_9BACL